MQFSIQGGFSLRLLILLLLLSSKSWAEEYCFDQAELLSEDFKEKMEDLMGQYHQEHDFKMTVVLRQSLEGGNIEESSKYWRQKLQEENQPFGLLLISTDDKKVRLELDKVFSPEQTQGILNLITPLLKEAAYAEAIALTLKLVGKTLAAPPSSPPPPVEKKIGKQEYHLLIPALILFFILFLARGKKNKNSWVLQPQVKEENLCALELVPVVLRQSSSYPVAHFRLSVLLSLSATPLFFFYLRSFFPERELLWAMLWSQTGLFFCGYLLSFRANIKRIFCTGSEMQEEVRQKARQLFYRHKKNNDKPLAMLVISLLEKKVELVAEQQVLDSLPANQIQQIIKNTTHTVKVQGFEKGAAWGIKALAEASSEKFPITLKEETSDE